MSVFDWLFSPITRNEIAAEVARQLSEQTDDQIRVLVQLHIRDIETHIAGLEENITLLGERMTSAENTAYARAAEVVGLIKAEFESLRQQVSEAATAGAAALEQDAANDAERISGLVAELETVLPSVVPTPPVEIPEVPVPEPGQPAELPPA